MKGFHTVNGGHKLYYEVYGNPDGIPILFLHGGPGMGFMESDKDFFDQKRFKVLFYDQRGSNRSNPFGSIDNNTTDLLVDDINSLTQKIGFDMFHIFGGSWGSTLALVYVIRNPDRVLSLILRGVFLANQASIDHYVNGGIRPFFPKVWEHFIRDVPLSDRDHIGQYYYRGMISGNKSLAAKLALDWARYELSIYKLDIDEEEVNNILQSFPYESLSKLEAHYMANDCFLPPDYILNNLHIIQNIDVRIVHGQYDMICPPFFAQELHDKLNKSELNMVVAGHAASEPKIKECLIQLLNEIN